tara:strand:- start:1501 stop:1785 length:285 start_codon:yes stop_codon:yes gene_type:complete
MAVGDITTQITANAGTQVSFVPAGSNEFLMLGVGQVALGYWYQADGANVFSFLFRSAANVVNGLGAMGKILITNAIYLTTYGTSPVSWTMVQTK